MQVACRYQHIRILFLPVINIRYTSQHTNIVYSNSNLILINSFILPEQFEQNYYKKTIDRET